MHAPAVESTDTHQHQINMVFTNPSTEDVNYPLTVNDIAQVQEDDAVLKKLSTTDKYPIQWYRIHKSYAKMATWSPPKFCSVEQLVGTTTTCSILDTNVLKRHYMQPCIGKV